MSDVVPRPARRLWRTFWRQPRNLTPFAAPIDPAPLLQSAPTLDEAAAFGEVLLLEDYVAVLHRDGTLTRRMHTVTMLHGMENAAAWDTIRREYDKRVWRPWVRAARVYLPDGRRNVPIQHDRLDPHGYYWSLSLAFAPLPPGTIVELDEQMDFFKPEVIAPAMWGEYFLRTGAPCRRRRLVLAVADPFSLQIRRHNDAEEARTHQVDGYRVYTWDRRDVAGVGREDWMPPPRDHAPCIDYSSLSGWGVVSQHFRNEIAPAAPGTTHGLALKLTRGLTGERAKAVAVYRYATRDVRSGRPQSELLVRSARPLGTMIDDLRGDCKDKSSLTVALLRELGMIAEIALLQTSQYGRGETLPSGRFDHAVVRATVAGETVWLDPAAGPFSFGELPIHDQGVSALILDRDRPSYVPIPAATPEQHRLDRTVIGHLTADGNLEAEVTVSARGERAAELRSMLLERTHEERSRLVTQFAANDLPGVEVSDIVAAGAEDLDRPAQLQYRLRLHRFGRRIAGLLLFQIPWHVRRSNTGLFAVRARTAPLQVPPSLIADRFELRLPDQFAGYGLPYDQSASCEWGSYRCRVSAPNGVLIGEREAVLRGGVVPVERFEEVRAFWAACADSDGADVALFAGGAPPLSG